MRVIKHSTQNPKMLNSRRNTAAILVAIPVFNEFKYVDNVLRAVNGYSDNILVVDDGSTDGTSDVLKKTHLY